MQIQHWIDAKIGISLFELPNHKMAATKNNNIRCHMFDKKHMSWLPIMLWEGLALWAKKIF